VLACFELSGVCCARVCVLLVRAHALQGVYVHGSARMSAHVLPVYMCASACVRTQVCLLACFKLLSVCCARVCVLPVRAHALQGASLHGSAKMSARALPVYVCASARE
jgi:hypothetical protein